MRIIKTEINGLLKIKVKKIIDKRGFFLKIFEFNSFFKLKLKQINISFFKKKNTFKGLHYQKNPFNENKVVFCLAGLFDVIIKDKRINSRTFNKEIKIPLDAKINLGLKIPDNCAVGYLNKTSNGMLLYYSDNSYNVNYENVVSIKETKFKKDYRNLIISNKDEKHFNF
jgi:dTDP-4-dehydrorhamnose 3,5-epimerase